MLRYSNFAALNEQEQRAIGAMMDEKQIMLARLTVPKVFVLMALLEAMRLSPKSAICRRQKRSRLPRALQ